VDVPILYCDIRIYDTYYIWCSRVIIVIIIVYNNREYLLEKGKTDDVAAEEP